MDGKLITKHCTDSRSKTYHGAQWVTAEVEVHGNGKIKHMINGETVLEYEKPQLDEKDADARKLIQGGEKTLREGMRHLRRRVIPSSSVRSRFSSGCPLRPLVGRENHDASRPVPDVPFVVIYSPDRAW